MTSDFDSLSALFDFVEYDAFLTGYEAFEKWKFQGTLPIPSADTAEAYN